MDYCRQIVADMEFNKRQFKTKSPIPLLAVGGALLGFGVSWPDYPQVGAWLERVRALPGWVHPYELMPGHPLKR